MAKQVNAEYFKTVFKFVLLYRDCMNKYGWQKRKEQMGRANINLEEDQVWQDAYSREAKEGVPDMPWRRNVEPNDEEFSNKSMKQANSNLQEEKDSIMNEFDHEYGEEEMIEMEEGEAEMFEEEYGGEDENEEPKKEVSHTFDEDMHHEGGEEEDEKNDQPPQLKEEEPAPDAKDEGPASISQKMLNEIQKQLDLKN